MSRPGLHHTGIDSEPFTPDESGRHAGRNDALEYVAKPVTFPKSMQPVLREGGVMRDLVIEVEPAEPSVRKSDKRPALPRNDAKGQQQSFRTRAKETTPNGNDPSRSSDIMGER
jgi:hypothetical protein